MARTAPASVEALKASIASRPSRRIFIRGYTRAATLVPIVEREGKLCLVFTARSAELSKHAGQISFPGGTRERKDRSAAAAALRETSEELGLDPKAVTPLGRLDDVAVPTGFVITPVAGWLGELRRFKPDRREVRKVITVPLSELADPERFRCLGTARTAGRPHQRYEFRARGIRVWGATARTVHDLLTRLGWPGSFLY
ncbi:MAG: CoA pyrophosphatase [Elusimicrobia bacterium]|nr:CoA pyrophosphatase [Elusimicrobiota bacterium]